MHSYAAYGKIFNMIYDPGYFAWLNSYDGFFVWCAARGGGDEGGYWHDSAKKIYKQKTMDDILACSQDLVKRKIAIKGKIILESDSAGAMAIAAVVNQAPPGLIGAALLERAVLDIFQIELRSSIGQANTEEFGDVNNQTEVASILAWSPLQNIDPRKPYPAILTIPGAEDSLVSPSNTYKYMAQLQYTHQSSIMPLLMFVAQGSGHKFSSVTVDEYTLEETHQICLTEVALGLKRRTG